MKSESFMSDIGQYIIGTMKMGRRRFLKPHSPLPNLLIIFPDNPVIFGLRIQIREDYVGNCRRKAHLSTFPEFGSELHDCDI